MPRWAEILLWLWLLSLVPVNDYQLWSITAYILFKGEGQFWVRPYEARAGEQSESPFWKCLFYTWKNFFFSSVLLDPCTSTNHLSILHIFHQIFSICFITIAKLIFFFQYFLEFLSDLNFSSSKVCLETGVYQTSNMNLHYSNYNLFLPVCYVSA